MPVHDVPPPGATAGPSCGLGVDGPSFGGLRRRRGSPAWWNRKRCAAVRCWQERALRLDRGDRSRACGSGMDDGYGPATVGPSVVFGPFRLLPARQLLLEGD